MTAVFSFNKYISMGKALRGLFLEGQTRKFSSENIKFMMSDMQVEMSRMWVWSYKYESHEFIRNIIGSIIRRLLGKSFIHLKCGVGRELCTYSGSPGRTSMWVLEQIKTKHCWRQKWQNRRWAYHEKAGFFGKENNAGEKRRQQEERKTK